MTLYASTYPDQEGKFRVVTEEGVVALNSRTNKPIDGGGNKDRVVVMRQAGHINASIQKRRDAET